MNSAHNVRKLALLSLIVVVACVSGVTATALGQDDVRSASRPEFAEDVPPLLPMSVTKPAATSAPVGGIDERILIAAAYWLLLGGVALRRARRADATPS